MSDWVWINHRVLLLLHDERRHFAKQNRKRDCHEPIVPTHEKIAVPALSMRYTA